LAVLHGDLAAYVRNDVLRHPLLPSRRYDARFSGLYNRELQVKMADMEMAEVTRNWPKMIWLHERAFRPEALQRVADKMTDSQYWAMVAEVWLDADIIDIDRWTDIWTLPRAYRDHVMTVDEHKALAQIPDDEITIYRGCTANTVQGLSWSLNPSDARMVAYRLDGAPLLVTATVEKQRIQAFFSGRPNRETDEVVVLERDYHPVSVKELPRRRARVMQAA